MNYDYLKKQSWYKNPEMMGHRWAAETIDMINTIIKDPRLHRTKLQKYIIANSFRFDKDLKWSYFTNQVSNKYISHVKHMLKRLTKENILSQLKWLEQRQGLLRTPLEKAMRVLAYKMNKKQYLEESSSPYKFYGMKPHEAKKHAEEVLNLMEKKLNKRW